MSDSVLVLYRSYPGDPGLQDYLKAAIQDGILPVSTFVATLLQAARSSELHIPATLDTLCRIALDAHYSSGKPPIGSVVPFSESPNVILETVQDGLALLRTAYSLPISHFHQLTASVSELVILLFSCVSDLSQLSTAQAMVYFEDVNYLLTNYRLTADVRQVLDTFLVSLTLLIGDDAKAAREAQMSHTIQFSLNKGDILGPSSDTDIISLGLLLNHLVTKLFLLLPLFLTYLFFYFLKRLRTERTISARGTPRTLWRCSSPASAGHLGHQPCIIPNCCCLPSHVYLRAATTQGYGRLS